jgi:mono/diheme cytochrome c family protein
MAKALVAATSLLMLCGCVIDVPAVEPSVAHRASQTALIDSGRALVESRCARCHAVAESGTSPYPGAQPFRKLGARWTRDQLRTALRIGIIAEHDEAEPRVPPMKLTDPEIDALLAYLSSIATPEAPAPVDRN